MLNYDNFGITLGRAVDVFRRRPDAIDEQKTVLRALFALTKLGGATVRLEPDGLSVEGTRVATTLPGITALASQMEAHGVTEIRIEQNAAAADLLHLLRALAVNLGGYGDERDITGRLRDSSVTTVAVLTVHPEVQRAGSRPMGVTQAFAAEEVQAALAEAAPPAPEQALEMVLAGLALDPAGPDILDRLTAAAEVLHEAIEAGRMPEVLGAIAEMVRLESTLPEGSARNSFAITLKRLLSGSMLHAAIQLTRDPATGEAARRVLRRAGADATEALIQRLVQAESMTDRRHYFDLLRGQSEGLRQVILMLGHPEWFAVRNIADLLGELRVEEAVPALARTLRHPDVRVRRAAALALARIGTAATVEHLAGVLREENADLRAAVAVAIGGREMEGLAMPLVLAAERERDPRALLEYLRALGRIGSPAAVQALARAAQPRSWRFWRRRSDNRLAAIEGLKIARGAAAIGTLEALLNDRDPEVRRAAREALEDLDVL
jgi:HEAT repeat protein